MFKRGATFRLCHPFLQHGTYTNEMPTSIDDAGDLTSVSSSMIKFATSNIAHKERLSCVFSEH